MLFQIRHHLLGLLETPFVYLGRYSSLTCDLVQILYRLFNFIYFFHDEKLSVDHVHLLGLLLLARQLVEQFSERLVAQRVLHPAQLLALIGQK